MATPDISDYVRARREHISRQTRHIRNPSVFSFDYIPKQPLVRPETDQLIDDLLHFELSGIPTHYAIVGSRGSGKTLTVKYLQRILTDPAKLGFVYANCREHNTSFKILAHLLGVSARGASLSELFERFVRQRNSKTVVVLDEIDVMSPKDRQREILYRLSRSDKPFMVLALANNPHVLNQLDPATRSSLQPMPLHFPNYNAQQLQAILHERAKQGLKQWDGPISEIAAMTTRFSNADARVAIKTLHYQVTKPEHTLQENFEQARRNVVIDLIRELSDTNLLILWAIATAKSDLARPIYSQYAEYCRRLSENPFSYMHFYTQLTYLQSVGLVRLVAYKVRRCYTKQIEPLFDRAQADEICRLRFQS